MNYSLEQLSVKKEKKVSTWAALKKLLSLMVDEKRNLRLSFSAITIQSMLTLTGPMIIGYTIDNYVQTKQYNGVIKYSAILLGMYMVTFVVRYIQTLLMGKVGQKMLFNLRNSLFEKLQELPLDFFNQNKAGDLISRINNDTDKLNQFFSQSLMQFVGNIFMMVGASIFLISLNWKLGLAVLAPALFLWFFNKALSSWVKQKNAKSAKSTGNLSAEVQESLNNFKVIVAFNRRDYFRNKFDKANKENYQNAVGAGLANNIFIPVYGFSSNLGQLIVLVFGIYLIIAGEFTVGLLISFLAYVTNFYNPLRHLASLWANFQVALAGWDRISQILAMENNLVEEKHMAKHEVTPSLLSIHKVSFSYSNGKTVLTNVNLELERGKTYALVGPTGGGKTTTASLIARLYDPTRGTVYLNGKDLRSITPRERADKIGFILQDPFLFSGNIGENLRYGNERFKASENGELMETIQEAGLNGLLERFEDGLDTKIENGGDGLSLGQKQLIAFMRTVLRNPEILILDEATANIDTVTEQLLEEILEKLPASTTRVIIAHRLNTIENADEIYFVNSEKLIRAGSLQDAVKMLMSGKKES